MLEFPLNCFFCRIRDGHVGQQQGNGPEQRGHHAVSSGAVVDASRAEELGELGEGRTGLGLHGHRPASGLLRLGTAAVVRCYHSTAAAAGAATAEGPVGQFRDRRASPGAHQQSRTRAPHQRHQLQQRKPGWQLPAVLGQLADARHRGGAAADVQRVRQDHGAAHPQQAAAEEQSEPPGSELRLHHVRGPGQRSQTAGIDRKLELQVVPAMI